MGQSGGSHEHNTIPCRRWLRRGWVCVRCGQWFREKPDVWPMQAFYLKGER
jgi:hypothetical protein